MSCGTKACLYKYERHDTCNLFIVREPLAGKGYLQVTGHRIKVDFALFIRDLVDMYYPTADKQVRVMDNLNTHTPAALYEVFEPTEARRLLEKAGNRYFSLFCAILGIKVTLR